MEMTTEIVNITPDFMEPFFQFGSKRLPIFLNTCSVELYGKDSVLPKKTKAKEPVYFVDVPVLGGYARRKLIACIVTKLDGMVVSQKFVTEKEPVQ